MLLGAIERTHGYLSKTVLGQHFAGTASKAVVGLRLERLPEFGLLKAWKKSHPSQLIDLLLQENLLSQIELKVGKQTITITELGRGCIEQAEAIPSEVLDFVNSAWMQSDQPESQLNLSPLSGRERDTVWSDSPSTNSPPLSPEALSTRSRENDQLPVDHVRPANKLPATNLSDATQQETGQSILADWQWTLRLARHGYRLGECALIRGKTPDRKSVV